MLARQYKLKKDNDFKRVFGKGKYCQGDFIRLKYSENNLDSSRLAIIVSAKVVKKAVERNAIKRRMEEILRLNWQNIKQGFDIILLIQSEIKGKDYSEIEAEIISLFKRIKLWKY